MGQHAEHHVSIPVDDVTLDGMLAMPPDAPGVVVFATEAGAVVTARETTSSPR